MANQPIPTKTKQMNPELTQKPIYTLLVDGDSLLQYCWHGCKKLNSRGTDYGGIFQFLLQLKILMGKKDTGFDHIVVVFDTQDSGYERFKFYPDYKKNRGKSYKTDDIHSDYYDQMDAFMKRTLAHSVKNKEKNQIKLSSKEDFNRQKDLLITYLEELFIRQGPTNIKFLEGDDQISYYCGKKTELDRIIVVSGDYDLLQLIDDKRYINQYVPKLKKFISQKCFYEIFGYHFSNVFIKKQLCGDVSDSVTGVCLLSEDKLTEIMPEIKTREIKLEEVIERAKYLNEQRVKDKKKPLAVYDNIINGKTNGLQRDLYKTNDLLMNLKNPILPDEAKEYFDDMMYQPIDPEGRSLENLYKMFIRDGIDELLDANKFSNFFSTFNNLKDKEIAFYNKWLKENNN